jgi:Ca-activated chloride channel family protein
MNRFFLILIFCSVTGSICSNAQEINKQLQSANQLYQQQQYEQAEAAYNKILELDRSNAVARFNLANTMFRRNKKDDAAKAYDQLAADVKDPGLKSKAYYNEGVALTKQSKLEGSIEAYKNALRFNPDDSDARENLEKSLMELKKKQPPKKKQDENKKKKQDQQKKQQQQQSKMTPKEAQQRLKLMEQKEKDLLQRMQNEKGKTTNGLPKDW